MILRAWGVLAIIAAEQHHGELLEAVTTLASIAFLALVMWLVYRSD